MPGDPQPGDPLLALRGLSVRIGAHEIVSIDRLDLAPGRRLGLVGESGSGKTMTAMGVAGLLPRDATVTGSIRLDGRELVGLSDRAFAGVRGAELGVVFQDPLRALNPMMRIGRQVAEAVRLHQRQPRARLAERVVELLTRVHLPEPAKLLRRYPHQLSGGQRQRVLIAIAIACHPRLLIADEPTTALDVTVQQGILELLAELSDAHGMGLLFVSHDLGVVRAVCEQVAVMYGGQLVEAGPVETVLAQPRHRYTEALIAANPGQVAPEELPALRGRPLPTVEGTVPPLGGFPSGCRFRDRCPHRTDACSEPPEATRDGADHLFRCWHPARVPIPPAAAHPAAAPASPAHPPPPPVEARDAG